MGRKSRKSFFEKNFGCTDPAHRFVPCPQCSVFCLPSFDPLVTLKLKLSGKNYEKEDFARARKVSNVQAHAHAAPSASPTRNRRSSSSRITSRSNSSSISGRFSSRSSSHRRY